MTTMTIPLDLSIAPNNTPHIVDISTLGKMIDKHHKNNNK